MNILSVFKLKTERTRMIEWLEQQVDEKSDKYETYSTLCSMLKDGYNVKEKLVDTYIQDKIAKINFSNLSIAKNDFGIIKDYDGFSYDKNPSFLKYQISQRIQKSISKNKMC